MGGDLGENEAGIKAPAVGTCAAIACGEDGARYGVFDMSDPRFFLYLCPVHASLMDGYLDSVNVSMIFDYQSQLLHEKHVVADWWTNTSYHETEKSARAYLDEGVIHPAWRGKRILFKGDVIWEWRA